MSQAIEELEVRLRVDPDVLEFFVAYESTGPRAWVVPQSSRVEVRERLRKRLRSSLNDLFWVAYLPRLEDGRIDEAALRSVADTSPSRLEMLQAQIRKQDGVQDAAVVTRPLRPQPPPPLFGALPEFHFQQPPSPRSSVGRSTPPPSDLSQAEGPALELPPDSPMTLGEALQRAARLHSDRGVLHLHPGGEDRFCSYTELLAEARQIAGGLYRHGVAPGQAVILHLDASDDFIPAFWGAIVAGAPLLPVSLPTSYEQTSPVLDRLQQAWADLGQPLVLAAGERALRLRAWAQRNNLPEMRIVDIAELRGGPEAPWRDASPDELAVYFLTSGSTGRPKIVGQRHTNLLAEAAGCSQARQQTPDDVSLNWMPLDHVGSCIPIGVNDVWVGSRQLHGPTSPVVADPLLWLQWMEQHRVTISWSPNFGYSIVAELGSRLATQSFDLSSVRYLINAGEAVVAKTARKFLELLAPFGLPSGALHPAFGMSELCSGITYGDHFSLETTSDQDVYVNVGSPIAGAAVRVVDERGTLVPEGQQGELQVRGPSVMRGYLANASANQEAFTADGWFRTGDLGVLRRGELTITGREKEVVVVRGVKYPCREIESAAEEVAGVEPSLTAACGVREPGDVTEQLILFFHPSSEDRLVEVVSELRRHISRFIGLPPSEILPLERDQIPRTGIGKLDRNQLKRLYQQGAFRELSQRMDQLLGRGRPIPDTFLTPILHPAPGRSGHRPRSLLLFGQADAVSDGLEKGLQAAGTRVIRVVPSPAPPLSHEPVTSVDSQQQGQFLRLSAGHFQLDPADPSHAALLMAHLRQEDSTPEFCLLRLDDPFAEQGPELTESLLTVGHFVRALVSGLRAQARAGRSIATIPLLLVTRGALPLHAQDASFMGSAGVSGLLPVLDVEYPELRSRQLDLGTSSTVSEDVDALLAEISQVEERGAFAAVHGRRYRAGLTREAILRRPMHPWPSRQGFYVVAGGLADAAHELIRFLLTTWDVPVLLLDVTREGEPGEIPTDQRATRLAALEELRGLGRLVYRTVDIRDAHEVSKAVQEGAEHFRTALIGVFHFAGVRSERPLSAQVPTTLRTEIGVRLEGASHLDAILGRDPKTLFVCFAFAEGWIPREQTAAYATSSRALASLVHERRRAGAPSHLIALSQWLDQSSGPQSRTVQQAQRLGFGYLEPGRILDAVLVTLSRDLACAIVGLDLAYEGVRRALQQGEIGIEEPASFVVMAPGHEPPAGTNAVRMIPRRGGQVDIRRLFTLANESRGTSAPQPPTTSDERKLAAIWLEVLDSPLDDLRANFFETGGDSLAAVRLLGRLREQFGVEVSVPTLFSEPTAAGLLVSMRQLAHASVVPLAAAPRQSLGAATASLAAPAQKRLWIVDRFSPGNPAYNIGLGLRLRGPLDQPSLTHAVGQLLQRHETLRAHFQQHNGQLLQVVSESLDPVPQSLTLSEGQLQAWLGSFTRLPFDLERGPLFRWGVVRLGPDDHVVALVVHHTVADGLSFAILGQELFALYESQLDGRPSPLAPLPWTYADWAYQQAGALASGQFDAQLRWWTDKLRGLGPLELPTDLPRPPLQSFQGQFTPVRVSPDRVESLRRFAQEEDATLFMVLLGAYSFVLSRWSNQEDLAVGTPIAGRERPELETLAGFFVNTLVLRFDLGGRPSLRELVNRTREVCIEAFGHPEVHLDRLVEALHPERDASRSPLYQTLFVLQQPPRLPTQVGPLQLERVDFHAGTSQVDLTLNLEERGGALEGQFEYDRELFHASTAERFIEQWLHVLDVGLAQPDLPLGTDSLLTPSERQRLLLDWSGPRRPFPSDVGLHDLVRQQAERNPDQVALEYETQSLTYRQMIDYAAALAEQLRLAGVGPDRLVALSLERGIDAIVTLLAILMAGGAYVPIDPHYPTERIAYMLANASPVLLITQREFVSHLPPGVTAVWLLEDGRLVAPDAPVASSRSLLPTRSSSAQDLAYVIYTSGSTGRPKGVLVEHRGVCNMVAAMREVLGLHAGHKAAQFASLSFDGSVFEIFTALTAGATLCLVPRHALLGSDLQAYMREHRVNFTVLPSSTVAFLDPAALPDLQVLCMAGDACPAHLVARFAPYCQVFNLYGPTEFSVAATYARGVDDGQPPPIGYPSFNTQAYVLDPDGELVPTGIAGELYLGGIQVARGYLRRPDLNEQHFCELVFPPEQPSPQRVYRTGDRVRWRADGQLEFLGRLDQQVKLRGFRIELGEVEAVLASHPTVQQSAVVIQNGPTPEARRMVAFAVSSDGSLQPGDLKAYLGRLLPDFAIPSAIYLVPSLPLSPSGKVDLRELARQPAVLEGTAETTAPRTPLEQRVASIWRRVLGVERVSLHDGFFELGGHSLLAAQTALLLTDALGYPVSPRLLLRTRTLAELVAAIESERRGEAIPVPDTALMLDDVARPLPLSLMAPTGPWPVAAPHVFLTGATGFLGVFLVSELLRTTAARLSCLVRASSAAHGHARLRQSLERYGLWQDEFAGRIVVLPGDLSSERFGLDEATFDRLAETVDLVLHNGSLVDMVRPYSDLRAANWGGTLEAIRLASQHTLKPLHYVSTMGVFPPVPVGQRALATEDDPLLEGTSLVTGYARSKWAAERLVLQARQQGLHASLHRPTAIMGDSERGAFNQEADVMHRLLRGCILLGLAPAIDSTVNLVPVDYVSRAIVTLALAPEQVDRQAHLCNPVSPTFEELWSWVRSFGYAVQTVSYPIWRAHVAAHAATLLKDSLGPLLAFFDPDSPAPMRVPALDAAHTVATLEPQGVRCEPTTEKQVHFWLSHLAEAGYLPPPPPGL